MSVRLGTVSLREGAPPLRTGGDQIQLPGVIRQLSAGTYDRQYAATELFDLLTAYEEGIVGPARRAPPTR